jgi:transcriptional regulator with XRE-family HTH domain
MHNIGAMHKVHHEDNKPGSAVVGQCPTCGSIRKDPLALTIRAIRRRLGLTQVAFSRMLSIQQNSLSRFETGDDKPSTERLIHLLRLAGTDGEREPIVAALEKRGVLASDLALSASTPLLLHESSIQPQQGECNV